jgi:hypothetical protein
MPAFLIAPWAWIRDLAVQVWTLLAGHPYLLLAALAGALIVAAVIGLRRAGGRS